MPRDEACLNIAMTADVFADIQLIEPFEDLPKGARGTILDTFPATKTYSIEFYEPARCVRTVPKSIVVDGSRRICQSKHRNIWSWRKWLSYPAERQLTQRIGFMVSESANRSIGSNLGHALA
jgi:hypothetical protein